MTLASGTKLGPYEILAPLGAGGMGEVYRAKDTRLDREVAIKVLPERLAEDREALSRFEREAKAVAALSHPNILAIHDVGADRGISYVVTELLNGETLRDRLRSSVLPWRRAVEHGVAIAQGLAAAHARGIVHRDLKPENVFLTTDGVVKILDFGLARVEQQPPSDAQPDAPTITLDTKPGTVLGTVNYMSPEQVRGRKADAGSDIFSFGSVLYEMVSGGRAFSGETAAETMTAILKHNPPEPSGSGAHSPPELDRVITRCLEKKPEGRFHSASDLAFTLGTILSDSGVSKTATTGVTRGRAKVWWAIAGVALVAGTGGVLALFRNALTTPARTSTVEALTTFVGREGAPTWSPDGSFFAYSHSLSGALDVFVMSRAGGSPHRLTQSPADDLAPRWSPDNAYLAFVSGRGPAGTGTIYLVPPLGGVGRKLVETHVPCVDRLSDAFSLLGATPWSPDAGRLLYSRLQPAGNLAIWSIDVATNEQVQVTYPEAAADDLSASWSFDGARIVFSRRAKHGSLWLLPAEGGKPGVLLSDQFSNTQPAWTPDSDRVVFSSNRSGSLNLWEIDVGTRRLRQLTSGPGQDQDPVVARNGSIAYAQFSHQTDLYVMSVGNGNGSGQRLTSNTKDNFAARFSPDGRRIAYHSDKSGNHEIWCLDRDTRVQRRLTNHPATDVYPDWSPDGTALVFVSDRDGPFRLWVCDADGGNLRRLCEHVVPIRANYVHFNRPLGPRWAPDGKAIGYLASGPTGVALWTVGPDGKDPRMRIDGVASFDWYLDSRRVIYTGTISGPSGSKEMHAADLETGRTVTLLDTPHTELVVARDGTAVAYCRAFSHVNMDLYMLRLKPQDSASELPTPAGRPEQLTRGQGAWHVHNGGWSPDSKEIVYTRDTDAADIYVIENDQQ